jgi:hypothetical protein
MNNPFVNEQSFSLGDEKLMNGAITKKLFTTLTFITLALAASLTLGLMSRYSANAKGALGPSRASITSTPVENVFSLATAPAAQSTGVVLPKTSIYALNADNTIFVLAPGATSFTKLVRVTTTNGNLIGIDFRVADGLLYALTDTGSLYTIDLTSTRLGAATLVSNLTPRFAGGFQSLMDFNPVLNAVRLIGSNDQNFAVVNSNGNLNATAPQTAISYAAGDVNAGVDPNIACGSYTNNFVGATVTLFYAIDYDLDTFVTIQPAAPGGSSATGGGKLQTIGRLVTTTGAPVNVAPTADIDIYSDGNGGNSVIGVSGRMLFTIDLSQISPNLALGTTQNVVTRGIMMPDAGGSFVDIAVQPAAATPAATPTPTPAPTPTPTPAPNPTPTPTPAPGAATTYQAENAILGGGSKLATNFPGFTGTGFVDYPDNIASGFTEFSVNQTGTRTFIYRYANGGAVSRSCDITINGVKVDRIYFQPTGSWSTWRTVQAIYNLGTGTGAKAVRVTAVTTAGGPNFDSLTIK